MQTLDPILIGAIVGGGILIGLLMVLALMLILRSGRRATPPEGETPGTGHFRAQVLVIVSGVLLISLGLPAALLALAADASPPEVVTPTTAPPEITANRTPAVTVEPGPTAEPETPEDFVLSRLQLTPDPDRGHNWYRVSVNVANTGDTAGAILLGAKVGDRAVAPQQIVLGAGDNRPWSWRAWRGRSVSWPRCMRTA